MKQSTLELEIDQDFFSKDILPVIHQVMMSNVKIQSKNFFNLVLSLRIGLLYNSLTLEEFQFILNQLILQKEFWKWRDPSHKFIDLSTAVDKQFKGIRKTLFEIYPDSGIPKAAGHVMPIKVFD